MSGVSSATASWARLRATHQRVTAWFGGLSRREALHRPAPDAWRPLDDLRHLILATDAVADAFSLPGEALEARFGLAEAPSRPCRELARAAEEALEGGATSPPSMVPPEAGVSGDAPGAVLERWRQSAARLEALEGRWDGEELDRYRVPHPFLGPLTLREWLCFNHVHARHHVEVAARRLDRDPGMGETSVDLAEP